MGTTFVEVDRDIILPCTDDDLIARYRQYRQGHVDGAARALDRLRPGWAARIDIGRLNLESLTCCILGQLFHPPWWSPDAWLWHLSGFSRGLFALHTVAPDVIVPGVFAALKYQDAWLNAIADRVVSGREGSPLH